MSDVDEVADEYRVAYQQLRHCEKRMDELEASLRRDHELAVRRYELARGAYIARALGEDDEFLKPEE